VIAEELAPRLHHAVKIFPWVALSESENVMRLAFDIYRRRDDWRGPDDIDSADEVWKQCFDLHRTVAGQRNNTPCPMRGPSLHPGKVAVQCDLPRPARLFPWCGNEKECVEHMSDDRCTSDERDVVRDADNYIGADTADSLWDSVEIGDNAIRANIDDASIPQQGSRDMVTRLSIDEDSDVMRMSYFLKTIQDGDGMRLVATVARVGQRTGIKYDAHRWFRYLSEAMQQSAKGRCIGAGWP